MLIHQVSSRPQAACARRSRLASFVIAVAALLPLLASPTTAATFIVDSTGDGGDLDVGDGICDAGGACTLRAAIEQANASPGGPDAIHFGIPGAGPHVVSPAGPLPALLEPTVVDGYTQPGSSPNTAVQGTNAVIAVVLDGSASSPGDGLVLLGGSSVVRGLAVGGWQRSSPGVGGRGLRFADVGDNAAEGNFLGTDATGQLALPNEESGVLVAAIDTNVVGGDTPARRNLVSGNLVLGIDVTGADNRIQGNVVGLDALGTSVLANERGIRVNGPRTVVGGLTPATRNVVSGNAQYGVNVLAAGDETQVVGNFVGTDVSGTVDLGNGGDGIRISSGALDVTVGGVPTAARNLVSGNNRHGIQLTRSHRAIVQGNLVGTDVTGTQDVGNGAVGILVDADDVLVGGGSPNHVAFNTGDGIQVYSTANQRNSFFGNSIHDNGQLGIDLRNDGVSPNDPADPDIGPNALQNFPVLASAVSDGFGTTIVGTLDSTPQQGFFVEFFASPECDASGFGEGFIDRGFVAAITDETGNSSFEATVPFPVPGGWAVTALATGNEGATSEFSQCVTAVGPPITITTTTTSTSTSLTSTSTTTSGGGSTTTTTLPFPGSPCVADVDCDDANACTQDTCLAERCSYTEAAGFDSVLCHVTNARRLEPDVACTGGCRCKTSRQLTKIERRYTRARLASSPKNCQRMARRGRRPSRQVMQRLARQHRKGCLETPPAATLLIDEATELNQAAETLPVDQACR
jgi:hypothetical protein